MSSRNLAGRIGIAALAIVVAACAASGANLQTGMTPDQAVAAMGQPDLRDSVPDPHNSSATVLRYTWVSAGKAATFGSDNRLATVQDVQPGSQAAVAAAEQRQAAPFDPIQTPFNYAFYPFKFAIMWGAAGINCVASGDCRKPNVPPPA